MTNRQFLRELARLTHETTQTQVAKRLGVNPSLISRVLAGREDPPPKLLRAMGLQRKVSYVAWVP